MKYSKIGDTMKIVIAGELDHHTCGALREKTAKAIEKEKPKSISVSFAGVNFCDSSGIAYILWLYRCQKIHGVTVEISDASSCVEKIFRLAAVDKYIKFRQEAK